MFKKFLALFMSVVILMCTSFVNIKTYADNEFSELYVQSVSMSNRQTGTADFDAQSGRGYDTTATDNIVRSFDSVMYSFQIALGLSKDQTYTTNSADVVAEIVLPLDVTYGSFNEASLNSLISSGNASYVYEYYDENDNLIASGNNSKPDWSINEHINGSGSANPYTTEVAKQKITISATLTIPSGTPIAAATFDFPSNLVLDVKAAPNGTLVKPEFYFYCEGNEDNEYIDVNNGNTLQSARTNNTIDDTVTVSAAPRFDAVNNTSLGASPSAIKYYNPTTGNISTEQTSGSIPGRFLQTSYYIKLVNESSVNSIKGCELPVGNINLDTITIVKKGTTNVDSAYFIELADTANNPVYKISENRIGRVQGETEYYACCFYAGDVTVGSNTSSTTGETDHTLTFSDYEFDFDGWEFPHLDSSGNNLGEGVFTTTRINYFVPVTSLTGTQSVNFSSVLDNLELTSASGDVFGNSETYSEYIKRTDANTNNTRLKTGIKLHAQGRLSGNIVFEEAGKRSFSSANLNTKSYYYGHSSYREQSFEINSDVRLANATDTDIHFVALLTKFDSSKIHLNQTTANKVMANSDSTTVSNGYSSQGDVAVNTSKRFTLSRPKMYFAADPLYPDGYDSDIQAESGEKNGVTYGGLVRMNRARAEDLIYFDSLSVLENAGYTCVGTMVNHKISVNSSVTPSGSSTIRNQVKYQWNSDAEIGTIACAVKDAYLWTTELNNELETDIGSDIDWTINDPDNDVKPYPLAPNWAYYPMCPATNDIGDVVNAARSSYTKITYENEQANYDTTTYVIGNANYLLDHISKVDIEAEQDIYNLDAGERNAIFNITPKTEVSSTVSSLDYNSIAKTKLYVKVNIPDTLEPSNVVPEICGLPISNNEDYKTSFNLTYKGQTHSAEIYYTYEDGEYMFYLSNVPIGSTISPISINTKILSSTNGAQITVPAEITSDNEIRNIADYNGNKVSDTITITRLNSSAIVKSTSNSRIFANGEIEYTVEYFNYSDQPLSDWYLYDVLPYQNDGRGTTGKGSEQASVLIPEINCVSFDTESVEVSGSATSGGYEFLFTEQSPSSVKSLMNSDWNNFNSIFTLDECTDYSTAVGVHMDSFPANSSIKLTYVAFTVDSEPLNTFCNNASVWYAAQQQSAALTSNTTTTDVIDTKLCGVVWEDENKDGIRQNDEPLLEDVTVTMQYQTKIKRWYNINENIYNSQLGQPTTVKTDENGYWEFVGLSPIPNKYRVLFSNSSTDFADYASETIQFAFGASANENSNARLDGNNYVIDALENVDKISIPELSYITDSQLVNGYYVINGLDAGFVTPGGSLPFAGNNSLMIASTVGVLLTSLTVTYGAYLYLKKTKKKNYEKWLWES